MAVQIGINRGVGVIKAKLSTNGFHVFRLTCQECPARFDAVALDVVFQRLGRIKLRLQGQGVHKHIFAQPVPQGFLYLHQIDRVARTNPGANRVHHVENNSSAPNHVVVEAQFFTILRG